MNRFFFLLLFIASGLSINAKSQKTTLEKLQGTWQSINDSKSVIKIQEFKQKNIYDKEVVLEDDFNLYDTCVSNASLKDSKRQEGSYLIIFEDGDILCYHIDAVDNNKLTLFYEGSGKFLTYKKMK